MLLFTYAVLFLLAGAGIYMLDRTVFIRMAEWWSGQTGKSGEAPRVIQRGLVAGRHVRYRLAVASAVSALQTIISVLDGSFNVFYELATMTVGVVLMVAGMYIAEAIAPKLRRLDPLLDRIDGIHDGNESLGDVTREIGGKAAARAREVGSQVSTKAREVGEGLRREWLETNEGGQGRSESVDSEPQSPKSTPPKEDPHEILKSFRRGRKSE